VPGDSVDRTTHLTGEYTRLEDELETQKINLRDINEFLSNELKAKETYCNELEKQMLDLEQTGEAEKAKFESEKTRMLEEFREREHDLQVRVPAATPHAVLHAVLAQDDLWPRSFERCAAHGLSGLELLRGRSRGGSERFRGAKESADCLGGTGRDGGGITTQEEIQNYEAKMKELAEFTEQKGALESEMADLRELLDSERRSHEELIADLERKAVQEKDRLKKEMVRVSSCSPTCCECRLLVCGVQGSARPLGL